MPDQTAQKEKASAEVTTFGQAAPSMFANGYTPIPLAPATKQPMLAGWSKLNTAGWVETDLVREIQHNANAACGWAIDSKHLAVDIDITDKAVAEETASIALKTLGDTPLVRIGQEPKRLLIYRTDESIRSRKLNPVELFAGTGQCAVFGWHAKAGRPYLWPHANLLDTAADCPSVPLVTSGKAQTFLSAIQPLIRPQSACRKSKHGQQPTDLHQAMSELVRRLPWRRAAQRLIEQSDHGNMMLTVYAVCASARRNGIDEDQLVRLLERHADHIIDVIGDDAVDRILDGLYGQPETPALEWATNILTHNEGRANNGN
ncbi:bifunctional DNA primase/polymerase [Ruegeria atlantica]|uniref:DNA primase/polymerase bifunctional N-terminal domain-containing protein n=1 Tax=Ruegeria atlantica TaxID=81569 RepID=A0A0P1E3I6_9RHOB|nr:bifunctional DNA primase/polymerase [Ruegeria atlantica]CUH42061.1 hypothetical protein RUM4293_00946 [Ruegeria atlantica]